MVLLLLRLWFKGASAVSAGLSARKLGDIGNWTMDKWDREQLDHALEAVNQGTLYAKTSLKSACKRNSEDENDLMLRSRRKTRRARLYDIWPCCCFGSFHIL